MLVSGFIDHPQIKKKQQTLQVLEAWYKHHYASSEEKPLLVIMIADFEQFNSTCIQELISVLCCFTSRLPFALIVGVATAFKAVHNVLPSYITNKLDLNIFYTESSTVMLNKILDEVVLSHRSPFQLSGKSFLALSNVFVFYDFSLHSFIKSYKLFMLEHFRKQPFNAILRDEEEAYGLTPKQCQDIRQVPSFKMLVEAERDQYIRKKLCDDNDTLKLRIPAAVRKMRQYLLRFHCSLRVLSVLFEDLPKNELGSLLRELYPLCISTEITLMEEFDKNYSLLRFTSKEKFLSKLDDVLKILRRYLNEDNSQGVKELKADLNYLENSYSLILESGMSPVKGPSVPICTPPKSEVSSKCPRSAMLEQLKRNAETKQTHHLLEYEQRLYECLDYLKKFLGTNLRPIQAAPALNEFFVFSDYMSVRDQIVGAPRGVLHNALNNPQQSIQCSCCTRTESEQILPTYPDTSIAYKLHRETNKFINLYDWLQSFAFVNGANDDDEEITPEIQ